MAYTFFLAKGLLLVLHQEEDWIERAGEMLKKAECKGRQDFVPIDNVVADHFGEDAVGEVVDSDQIPDDRNVYGHWPQRRFEALCDASRLPRPSSGMSPWRL